MKINAITLNHRQTFLLHSSTLACVKAEIDSPCSGIHTSQKFTESLRRSNVYIFYL